MRLDEREIGEHAGEYRIKVSLGRSHYMDYFTCEGSMTKKQSRPAAFKHVDDQLRDALTLGHELLHPSVDYPEVVYRAMRLAYAIHFRVLLEFLHADRPPDRIVRKDIGWSKPRWTKYERRRFVAADKLAAHMTAGRSALTLHRRRLCKRLVFAAGSHIQQNGRTRGPLEKNTNRPDGNIGSPDSRRARSPVEPRFRFAPGPAARRSITSRPATPAASPAPGTGRPAGPRGPRWRPGPLGPWARR